MARPASLLAPPTPITATLATLSIRPALGRFTQPDSLVPNPGNPMDWDRYAYVRNNPVNNTDSSGHWVDAVVDGVFIGADIYDIQQNGWNWENGLALAADVVGAAIPIVTGLGLAVHAGFKAARAADKAADAVKVANTVDNVLDTANAIDSAKAGDNLVDAFNAVENLPNKPYSNISNRPSCGKNQVETVWENAKQIDGNVYDPYTGEQLTWDKSIPRNGQWDMGHTPDHQYKDIWRKYMKDEIGYDEFMRQYRDPDNYLPQSANSNRSRRYDQQ